MAEAIETEYRIRVDDAIRDLQKLRRELGEVGDATEETGDAASSAEGKWGNFSQQITAGVLVFNEIADAVSGAVDQIREFGLEFERQAGILNRFTGDVSVATDRTNGLFRSLDLMVAQQRALQAGLNLSAEEFATLAVAANESASALGGDNVQALDRLVQAMTTGAPRALRAFNIDIRGLTDASEIQTEVMGALSERYGDVESSADTLGGGLVVLENRLADAETKFFEIMSASKEAETAFEDMWETVNRVFGGGPTTMDGMIRSAASLVEGALAGLATVVREYAGAFGMFGEAFDELTSGNWSRAASLFTASVQRLATATATGATAGAEAASSTFAQGGGTGSLAPGGGSGGGSGGGGGGGGGGRSGGGRSRGPSVREQQDELFSGIMRGATTGTHELDEEIDSLGVTIENVFQQGAKDIKQPLEDMSKYADSVAAVRAEMVTLNDVGSSLWQLFEEGPERALATFLRATGQRNTLMALEELAKAAGSYPDFVGIEQHLQSAALHGAVAVAAGAGSAALGSGGGGGSAAARPVRSGGGGGGSDGGQTVVNINFNSPVDEATMGRQQERARRESRRRFGR